MEGTDLVDDGDQRELQRQCADDESTLKLELMTDNYPWETSYNIRSAAGIINSGPNPNTNFAANTMYVGSWCVPAGQYTLKLKDQNSDGFCCQFGQGYAKIFVNDVKVLEVKQSSGAVNDYDFSVAPFSARGNTNGGSGSSGSITNFQLKSCYNVQVRTQVDQYGGETSFKIHRRSGKTVQNSVALSMGTIVAANSQETVSDCLEPGEYALIFEDPDGICCAYGDGFFELSVDGEKLITGGRFSGEIRQDFTLGHDWESTMNDRDRDFLVAHNERRRDWHGRFNKPYRPLKWSTGLAADAKRYAEALQATCEQNGITHEHGVEQGENLAKNRGGGSWGEQKPAENFVKRWIDNEEFWGWNANAHLTQALWYPTRYIGCGESVQTMDNGQMCRFTVCRFAKAGNCMMGQYVNARGENWEEPMMMDDSPCGPMCPPGEGCFI